MKCRICGCECPPGAKLCRDCAAARKRAFAATVTMPLLAAAGVPTASGLRFVPKPKPIRKTKPPREASAQTAAPVSVRRGQEVFRPEVVAPRPAPGSMKAIRRGEREARSPRASARDRPARRMPLIAIAGATMLVAVIAVLELRTVGGNDRASDTPDVAPSETSHMTVPAAPAAPTPAEPQAATAAMPVAADAQNQLAAEVPPAGPDAIAVVPPKPAARKRSPETVRTPAPVQPAVAEEPAPKVAAAPAQRAETARTDPLQSFDVALARCAREDLMARVGCEQRVRLQYCGDAWGQIAQCSIGRATEHGQ
jgi:hypothetical protein